MTGRAERLFSAGRPRFARPLTRPPAPHPNLNSRYSLSVPPDGARLSVTDSVCFNRRYAGAGLCAQPRHRPRPGLIERAVQTRAREHIVQAEAANAQPFVEQTAFPTRAVPESVHGHGRC